MEEKNSYILSDNVDIVENLSKVAEKFFLERDFEKALKVYNDLLLHTSDSELYVKMGTCYMELGKVSTALEYWEQAITRDAKNINAYIKLGNYFYKNKEREKAITYWIASLLVVPEEPITNLNLAITFAEKSMNFQAITYYEKYMKYAQDKSTDTYKQVTDLLIKNKKNANEYLKLGVNYQSINDITSAAKCYMKALSFYPNSSKANLNLGSLYFIDKNYAKAIKYWIKASYILPEYPKILNNLALAFDLSSKFDYAFCYYTRYSKHILQNKTEYDKVVSRCHKIKYFLNQNPHLIENHLTKANNAFSNCEYHKAMTEFENYIHLKPDERNYYTDIINKITSFINPEENILTACRQKAEELYKSNKFKSAAPYYARMMVLAEKNSGEFVYAKSRLSKCIEAG